jgi:hypothetical protein
MTTRLSKALRLDPMERLNLTLSAGAVAVGFAAVSPAFAGSCALGAALEAVNFRALRASAARLLAGELQGGGIWTALLGMRLTMLFVSMGVALAAGAHPIGLLVGVSMIVPAALIGAWIARPPVDPSAPALAPDDPDWESWSVWRGGPAPADPDEVDA